MTNSDNGWKPNSDAIRRQGTPTEQLPRASSHVREARAFALTGDQSDGRRTDPTDLADGQVLERRLYGRQEEPMKKSRLTDERMLAILREKRA